LRLSPVLGLILELVSRVVFVLWLVSFVVLSYHCLSFGLAFFDLVFFDLASFG